MKRKLSVILAAAMVIAILLVIPFATLAGDTDDFGSVDSAYTPEGVAVTTAEEFAAMTADGKYYLANNIELSATYPADFTGTLDGNGKTLTVSAPVFKNLKGTVKNLKIAGTVNVSDYDAGALAQRADSATVDNVLNTASVTGSKTVLAEEYVFTNVSNAEGTLKDTKKLAGTAGLVGSATGVCVFSDCKNTGAVNGSPAGGIVGVMGYEPVASSFTFTGCYNEGTISDNGCSNEGEPNPQGEDRGVGGIAGFAMDAKTVVFEYCHNIGAIDATFADDGGSKAAKTVTGGIFGFVALATNTNSNDATLTMNGCTNSAEVKGSGQTGGILGYNGKCNATVQNCENKEGVAVASTTSYVGGIAARLDGTSTVENCNNYGSTFSAASGNMGGICGYMAGTLTIKNCVNHADIDVTSSSGRPFGGILGSSEKGETHSVHIENCKNLGDLSAGGRMGGIVAQCENGTVINCVNEGNINSGYAQSAGIIGYANADTTVRDCLNNGNVISTHTDTSSKGAIGGIVGYANTKIFVYNSVNNGDIESAKGAVGGMVGNINQSGTFDGCLNTGDIKGTNQVGGIVGYFGTKNDQGKEIILRSGNTGNVTATTGDQVAGLAGYVYGGSVKDLNETIFMYNYSTGTISGKNAGAAIGYVNSGVDVAIDVKYNFFSGALVKADTGATFIVYNNHSSGTPTLNMEHNYYPDGYAEYEKYLPKGENTNVAAAPLATATSLASGEIAYKLNAAIKAADATITADVFYQTIGTDATPVLDNTHGTVYKLSDGTYSNTAAQDPGQTTTPSQGEVTTKPSDDVTTKPADVTTKPADVTTKPADITTKPADVTTTPADTTTEAPDDVTTTDTPTTDTPKKNKNCGSFALAAQLITILGAAITVIVVKKKN